MDPSSLWSRVDAWVAELFGLVDPALSDAVERCEAEGLPSIQVSAAQGHFLRLLVRAVGAKRVLEVGTLGGFSAILLARGLADDGVVVSLEVDRRHAEVARRNVEEAGLGARIRIVEGDAHASLAAMIEEGAEPFDLIFLDAEKTGYPAYLDAALALSRTGTVIVADNVVRGGDVLDEASDDPNVAAVRQFNARVASDPSLSATVLQTVGDKGHDGFLLAVVA